MAQKIYNLDLIYNGSPVPFAISAMEKMTDEYGGIAEDPHRHNYYSVIWSFTATGRHIIDFKNYPLLPHHIFFVSPKQVHQLLADPEPTGLIILFTPEFLQKYGIRTDFISNLKLFRDSDDTPPLQLNDHLISRLREFTDKMFSAFEEEDEMRLETIGAYLKLFLIECNRHITFSADTNTQNIEVSRSLVQHFKQLVELHFREWHQVKDYAALLNVSPNYLNEVIKSNIRVTVKDYIQHRIILEARRMILFTERSSKEIGFDLGYEDPSHFTKFYKRFTGETLLRFKDAHHF